MRRGNWERKGLSSFFFSQGKKKYYEQTLNWKSRASNKVTLLSYLRLMSVRKEEGLPN